MKWSHLAFSLVFYIATVCAEPLQIATGESKPYASATSKDEGYLNNIIREAFAQESIEVEFVYMPWSRSYKEAQMGKYIATSFWFDSPKHQQDFIASAPLNNDRIVFFRKRSDLPVDWSGFSFFSDNKLKMGLNRGYTYSPELWAYADENPKLISIVNSGEQNLRMLLLGRIDVFPEEEVTGWYLINRHFSEEQRSLIEVMRPSLKNTQSHLMFSRKHPKAKHYLSAFNHGLDKLKLNGRLETLKNRLIEGYY